MNELLGSIGQQPVALLLHPGRRSLVFLGDQEALEYEFESEVAQMGWVAKDRVVLVSDCRLFVYRVTARGIALMFQTEKLGELAIHPGISFAFASALAFQGVFLDNQTSQFGLLNFEFEHSQVAILPWKTASEPHECLVSQNFGWAYLEQLWVLRQAPTNRVLFIVKKVIPASATFVLLEGVVDSPTPHLRLIPGVWHAQDLVVECGTNQLGILTIRNIGDLQKASIQPVQVGGRPEIKEVELGVGTSVVPITGVCGSESANEAPVVILGSPNQSNLIRFCPNSEFKVEKLVSYQLSRFRNACYLFGNPTLIIFRATEGRLSVLRIGSEYIDEFVFGEYPFCQEVITSTKFKLMIRPLVHFPVWSLQKAPQTEKSMDFDIIQRDLWCEEIDKMISLQQTRCQNDQEKHELKIENSQIERKIKIKVEQKEKKVKIEIR